MNETLTGTRRAESNTTRFRIGDFIRCEVPKQPVYHGEVVAVQGDEVQFWCAQYEYLLWVPVRFCRADD